MNEEYGLQDYCFLGSHALYYLLSLIFDPEDGGRTSCRKLLPKSSVMTEAAMTNTHNTTGRTAHHYGLQRIDGTTY
jgi:hypothetical protein